MRVCLFHWLKLPNSQNRDKIKIHSFQYKFLLFPQNRLYREKSDVINVDYACWCCTFFATEERFLNHKCFVKNRTNKGKFYLNIIIHLQMIDERANR